MSEGTPLVRLIAINPDRFSLGLAYLHAALNARFGAGLCVEQSVVDLDQIRRREIDLAALAFQFVEGSPAVIGLSWYCWNHRVIQDLARLVHGLAPGCQLIVGGPETGTIDDAALAAFPAGTLLVVGEGEEVFVELVGRVLDTGTAAGELPPGAVRVEQSSIVRAPRRAALPTARIRPRCSPGPFGTPPPTGCRHMRRPAAACTSAHSAPGRTASGSENST